MNLHDFKDIHTHNPNAGDDAIINLPWGEPLPDHGYYSIGIHPWDTAQTTDAELQALDLLCADERIVAIGETGLDALRGAPLERQEQIFRQHVAVSERLQKPLIIHAVRTLSEIMRLRKELKPHQRWIIHGFRGRLETARQLIDAGIDISIGKKHNPGVPGCVPADRLFHESDMDF